MSLISTLEDGLRKEVNDYLANSDVTNAPVSKVLGRLRKENAQAYFFGGFLRGLALGNNHASDIDIVVDDMEDDDLFNTFDDVVEDVNEEVEGRYGLRIEVDGQKFDLWHVHSSWAFSEGHVKDAGFPNLPQTTFLNMESVCVNALDSGSHRAVYHNGFFEGCLSRTLEVNLHENYNPTACVIRSLVVAHRLHFGLGKSITDYIIERVPSTSVTMDNMITYQQNHYGDIVLHDAQINKVITDMKAYRQNVPNGSFWMEL